MVTVEDVDFITIPTRDIDRARRFYGETLGRALSSSPGGPPSASGRQS
jgi:catechol 2,3-dioxygenase-like lactoylglutathione lyase family enzyme